jgi:hypothetical protein
MRVSRLSSESEHALLVADTNGPTQVTLYLLWRAPPPPSSSGDGRGFATMQDGTVTVSKTNMADSCSAQICGCPLLGARGRACCCHLLLADAIPRLRFTALSAPLPPAGTVLVSTFMLFRLLLNTQVKMPFRHRRHSLCLRCRHQDRWSSLPQRMLEIVLATLNPAPAKRNAMCLARRWLLRRLCLYPSVVTASGLYWSFRRTLVALSSAALLSPNDLVVRRCCPVPAILL